MLGGFMGLVVACTLVGLSTNRQRKDYEPDRASCLSCGRCFLYCPREHLRRKKLAGTVDPTASAEAEKS